MNYELQISPGSLVQFQSALFSRMEEIKQPVHASMAEKFFEIVRLNFGDFGVDRPVDWAPLSPRYAKKVGREHATLFVTGKLEGSVKMEADEDRGRVSVSDEDVEYATRHQYGDAASHLPARPYFPIDDNGNPMAFTQAQVEEAARAEVERLLGSSVL